MLPPTAALEQAVVDAAVAAAATVTLASDAGRSALQCAARPRNVGQTASFLSRDDRGWAALHRCGWGSGFGGRSRRGVVEVLSGGCRPTMARLPWGLVFFGRDWLCGGLEEGGYHGRCVVSVAGIVLQRWTSCCRWFECACEFRGVVIIAWRSWCCVSVPLSITLQDSPSEALRAPGMDAQPIVSRGG